MDTLKILNSVVISFVFAYLGPITNVMGVLFIIFLGDILMGVLTDKLVNNTRISVKKLLVSIIFLTAYISIVIGIFIITDLMGDRNEGLYIIKTITYVCVYFYATNILRNLTQLAPDNKFFSFLDYWIGLECIKKIPGLNDFLKRNNNKSKN